MATAYTDQVQKVYIAYYGRAADPVGLTYWAAKVETDGLAGIMAQFGASAEATTLYGSLSDTAMVNALYQQSFGRDADFAGLMYYAGQLTAGTMTAVTIAQNIFDGASGSDATILANKLIVAKAYTAAVDTASEVVAYAGTVAAASARALLTTVDADTVTASFDVATSVASIVTVSSATPAVAGTTVALTATTDTLVGGAGADIFNSVFTGDGGTGTTLAPGDSITGGAGVDTLSISVAGTATSVPLATIAAVSAAGLEKITLSNFETSAFDHTVDTSLMTGLATVGLSSSGTAGDVAFTNVKNLVEAQMHNGAGNLTVTYNSTVIAGTTDTQTLNVSNLTAGTFTAAGTETVIINGGLVKSTLTGVVSGAITKLTATGDKDLTISNATSFAVTTSTKVIASTIDASAMTGKFSVLVGDTSTVKVTGGSAADTINMAGTLETNDVIDGGDGVDTLSMTGATLGTHFTNVTNVETVAFNEVETAQAMNIAKLSAGVTKVILDVDDGAVEDGALLANTVTGLAGQTVVIRHSESDASDGADDDGVNYTITNATDTAADSISIELDGIGTGSVSSAATNFGINAIDVNAFETVNIASNTNSIKTVQADGTTAAVAKGGILLNTLDLLTVSGTTKTVALTGATNLTITQIAGSVMTSLDASAMTGKFVGTLTVADDIAVKLAVDSSTINFGSTLNNKDSVVGGAGAADIVSATVTGLAASTGALTISAVETINLATTGNNTLNLAGITGATTIQVTQNVQTISGLDLGTTIHLNASATASEIDVTAADATGTSDTLKVSTTGTVTSIVDASAIETLAITKNDAANLVTLDLTTFDGAAITLASKTGITGGAAVALGTLNANANSLTSTYANAVSTSFVNATGAVTATVNGTVAQTITGSGFLDTFNVGSTTNVTHVIAGGAGEDTINYTSAEDVSAEFGSISEIQTFNLIVANAADVTVNGAFHADVDDITVTGGNTTSTLTTSTLGAGVETLEASGFSGNIVATVAANSLDSTVTFTGGDTATDKVLNAISTAATTYALKSTGVELLDLDINVTGATTVSLSAATGVTGVSVDLGAAVAAITATISNVTDEVITLKAHDNTSAAHTLAASLTSSTGTADTIAFKMGAGTITSGAKLKTDNVETVSINMAAAASLDLSLLSMTTPGKTMALTTTGTTALTISALNADVISIDASAMGVGGSVVQTGRSSTAAADYKGAAGADTFMMLNKSDVMNGGAGTDTLDINFAAILGGIEVDLSSTTDQVVTFNGGANSAVQKTFDSVDVSGYTGTFGAQITAIKGGSTITGTGNADVMTGGAGADIFRMKAATDIDDADTVAGGAGANTVAMDIATTAVTDADFANMTLVQTFTLANGTNTAVFGTAAATAGIITINGGTGNDNITSAAGSQTVVAGNGANAVNTGLGADAVSGGTGITTITHADGHSGAYNTTAAKVSSTAALDVYTVIAASNDVINLATALNTEANYDTFTTAADGAALTATGTTTTIGQFKGVYDADADTFTSTATGANSVMLLFNNADGGTYDEAIIVVGVTAIANGNITNGVITS